MRGTQTKLKYFLAKFVIKLSEKLRETKWITHTNSLHCSYLCWRAAQFISK